MARKPEHQRAREAARQNVVRPDGSRPSADDEGASQTTADNVSEAPTSADDTELVRISGRIVKWQRDKLERIAARDGRLFSDVLREAVREFLRGH